MQFYPPSASSTAPRLLFLDALRAVAALTILWHHFSLYPPLRDQAAPLFGTLLDWFRDHGRATQVFFVVGGYVMARSMAHVRWSLCEVWKFIQRRYYRLGLPYLLTIALAIPICAINRSWLPEHVVGVPPTVPQLLSHLVFMQDILGYESFSAGLWFVCINFQLGLLYAATLWLRDVLLRMPSSSAGSPWRDASMWLGWCLAIFSLFFFNLDPDRDCWAPYFFPYFFMGIIVHRGLRSRGAQLEFWLYQLLMIAGMAYGWRWRLLSALVVGLLLFGAEKSGLGACWPKSRIIANLGRVSYSLFLIHFPVLVLVSGLWARFDWSSPQAAVAGLFSAFILSVGGAFLFHRWVESPAGKLTRRLKLAAAR